ncbi:MAG: class I SAM-dependent methyltransferase [Caldilineaceae bacterium]|nr:class I SAM-dependent methyltransferase [Caldilineaceae bacterium]MCY3993495.1 class I SAM-dependent methyltransferase [Caldilineaceae bacterium]
MTTPESSTRFNGRVENYLRYRPRYPQEIIPFLQGEIGLDSDWRVADIGSGTGFLAERFVRLGCGVTGVEPNMAMREAGERYLRGHCNYCSVDGTAENSGLPEAWFDLVTAGQAFHWFEQARTREEFKRILRPPGWVVLVWNSRPASQSIVTQEYESILETLEQDYQKVAEKNRRPENIDRFLDNGASLAQVRFPNLQFYTWDQLRGRALSSSYAPLPSDQRHEWFVQALRALFERHKEDGLLAFPYETNLYWGQLK